MEWCTGNLKVIAAVLCLFITFSGAVQLDDCQGGYIHITNDTKDPSTIKCSGLDKITDATVTWFIGKNSNFNWAAVCSSDACTLNSPDVTAVRRVDSGFSILRITQNHQQVAGGDALVKCQSSSGNGVSANCTIRIIDKLPSITITGASHPLYAGEMADLKCVVAATEPLPSLPLTYTWTWNNGAAVRCDTSVTLPNVCRFYLDSQHNKAGVTCILSYKDYANINGKRTTVILNVKYPPPQPPVITGTTEVYVGESLTLECRVYSGNPLVTAVTFSCVNHGDVVDITVKSDTDDTSYVSSNITIQPVQASDDGNRCLCDGNWENTGLYRNISTVTLNVTGTGTAQPTTSAGTAQPPVTSTVTAQPSVTSAITTQPPLTSAITTQPPVTTTGSHGNTDSPEITPSTTTVNPAITPLTSTVTDGNTDNQTDIPPNIAAIAGGVVAAVVVIAVVVVVVVFIIKRRNSRPKPPPSSARDPEYDTEEHINPVYGTDDRSTNHNDIYGGGAAHDEIPDMGYSAVGTRAHHPTTKSTANGGSSAAGEEYAVVDKSKKPKKNGAHAQNPQNTEYAVVNKPRKNQSPAQPHDEYAVVDKSRKNQPPAPTQDEYAVVDKSRKKPAAKPKPGLKPKPNAAATPAVDDEYNSLSFQQSSHAPQQSRDVEQDYSHLADVRSDADR